MPKSTLAKFRQLSGREKKLFWACWRLLPRILFKVRRMGANDTREWLTSQDLRKQVGGLLTEPSRKAEEAQNLARLVNVAARYGLFKVRCLERSLLIEALCQARGIDCELKFGVNNDGRPFMAHAWVELDGQPLGDRGSSDPTLNVLG